MNKNDLKGQLPKEKYTSMTSELQSIDSEIGHILKLKRRHYDNLYNSYKSKSLDTSLGLSVLLFSSSLPLYFLFDINQLDFLVYTLGSALSCLVIFFSVYNYQLYNIYDKVTNSLVSLNSNLDDTLDSLSKERGEVYSKYIKQIYRNENKVSES